MKNSTKLALINLALDITRNNLEKYGERLKSKPSSRPPKTIKTKIEIVKNENGITYFLSQDISGKKLANLKEKNCNCIQEFIDQVNEIKLKIK